MDIAWQGSRGLCRKCGRYTCCCKVLKTRGIIKPAFSPDGTIAFLIEESRRKRWRATASLALLLQGWELIRHVHSFVPLEQEDERLAQSLNELSTARRPLEVSITHSMTWSRQRRLPLTLRTPLVIAMIDTR